MRANVLSREDVWVRPLVFWAGGLQHGRDPSPQQGMKNVKAGSVGVEPGLFHTL